MRHDTGLAFRLKLLALPEPWYTPIHWLHDIAYDHLSDIDLRVVMLAIREGAKPDQAAKDWIAANPERVESWLK